MMRSILGLEICAFASIPVTLSYPPSIDESGDATTLSLLYLTSWTTVIASFSAFGPSDKGLSKRYGGIAESAGCGKLCGKGA